MKNILKKCSIGVLALWMVWFYPVVLFAQEVTSETVDQVAETPAPTDSPAETGTPAEQTGPLAPTGTPPESTGPPGPTGAPATTGAPACTGAACTRGADQGQNQGANQGTTNGGPSPQDLGATQNESGEWVLPAGTVDTRQGARQGTTQGATNGTAAANTNTGQNSTNSNTTTADTAKTTTVGNTATNTTNADVLGNTGQNTNNQNTNSGPTTTGNANIGVTQLVQDNTTSLNGAAGLNVTGYNGTHQGDLEVAFANAVSLLTGEGGSRSIRAINNTTGQNSSNDILLSTNYEELNEIQNDGLIDNQLTIDAITGQNEASMNTGNGSIATGDANISATLLNLLNTTVINGNLSIAVHDIFGDLLGNIVLPDLSQLASVLAGQRVEVNASNDLTGSDSTNTIDIDLTDKDLTKVKNEATIDTTVNANAITGQNETFGNTGGGEIDTGDASVSASSTSIANTTVEGGNWMLVIVNAVDRWLGFLVGDSGQVQQLSQEQTIREIEAHNGNTGADSTNTIDIGDTTSITHDVTNNAQISNTINANAITGQNEASKNTGRGDIDTGQANILASTVNLANTTVKNANLGIAVINIFGSWLGDLLYGGQSLLGFGGGGASVEVNGGNTTTGADSKNSIDVTYNRERETDIENDAHITTTLNATVDTGNNKANKNTNGADIETGNGKLSLHSRAIANIVGIFDNNGLGVNVSGKNDITGATSENTINANVNDKRVIAVNNDANISTVIPGSVNTGNNEASMNTVGGNIDTGNITASVGIHNLVNRVIYVLGNEVVLSSQAAVSIGSELMNRLTGSNSDNRNAVDIVREVLASLLNNAVIDNLVDLIFNTGGNKSNQNTSAYSTSSVNAAPSDTSSTAAGEQQNNKETASSTPKQSSGKSSEHSSSSSSNSENASSTESSVASASSLEKSSSAMASTIVSQKLPTPNVQVSEVSSDTQTGAVEGTKTYALTSESSNVTSEQEETSEPAEQITPSDSASLEKPVGPDLAALAATPQQPFSLGSALGMLLFVGSALGIGSAVVRKKLRR